MPGNEIEERIRILYELEKFSQGQHQSQTVNDSRPVLIYNQWVEKQRQISEHLKNYTIQQLDSLGGHGSEPFCAFDQNYGQLTRRPDLPNSLSTKQGLNTNGFMLGRQNFLERQNELEFLGQSTGFIPHNLASRGLSVLKSQPEYAPGDSPTLTTNSERSEMTDASTEFNFVGGQQQLVSGQQPGVPQPTSMQQPGYNDVQLLKQHIMLKQLQEFQKQQQLQQFGDARQLSQHSSISKQGSGGHSMLMNGTPVNDASQMFMNRVQRGASPSPQGISNRSVFSQEQGQTLRSMPPVSQQLDGSLYGTPVANTRSTMSHFPNVQGMPNDSPNVLNKVGSQIQKPVMQSMAVSNPFLGDQYNFSHDQVYLPQGAFTSKHGFQGKNTVGHVPLQGLNGGATLGNSLLGTSLEANAPLQELCARQEPAGWPGDLQQKSMQHAPPQDLVSLDPMEEKILFNMDDDVWNPPFGGRSDMVSGGFGNALEQTELNVFPSLQSGSWSALMQSAVAEASSSDTGMQEEWSGLTFQNTELSIDNQTSSILDNEKQQRGWADSNLQSDSSLGSKPLSMLNDSSVNSGFPGFHPTGIPLMTNQREDLHQDDSHDSIQKTPKDTSEWLDCNPQPTLPTGGSEQVQRPMHLDNSWASQISKLSENNANQQRIASYGIGSKSSSKPEGSNEAIYKKSDSDVFPWKTGGDSFSRSTGGLAQVESDTESNLLNRENAQMFNFTAVPASLISKAHQETNQQVADGNQLDYMAQAKISMKNGDNDNMGVKMYQMSNITDVMQNSYRASEAYGQQQNCSPRDNSQKQGHFGQFNFMGDVSNNTFSLDKGCPPNFQGDLRASEELSGRNLNISATFHRSVGSSDMNAQTSQDMLELLPKVDQLKENISVPHFGSTGFSPLHEVAEARTAWAPIAQTYNQSSASQGFALRLSPPSLRLANSNNLISQGLQQTASKLNLRQRHSAIGEKNQTQLTPSFQSFPGSNELSPRESWDNKFNTAERSNMSSSLYVHQSSVGAIPSNPPFTRNQLQMQLMSNGPVSCSSPQATLHGAAGRYPSFNLGPLQDTSQQIRGNLSGQRFPGLEVVTTSQPPVSMLQQGGFSARPPTLWTSMQQHLSGMEPCKVPSLEPSRNSMESTSVTQQELNDQNSRKCGYEPSELGAASINYQGSVLDEEPSRKEGLQKLMSSGMVNALQAGARNISDKNSLASSPLVTHLYQQDLDRFHHTHNHSPTGSERSHESFDRSMKPSQGSRQNYSLLHQVQAKKNAETDQSRGVLNLPRVSALAGQQSAYEPNSTSRNLKDDGLKSAAHPSSLTPPDNNMSSFLPEAREDPRVKGSSKPPLQDMPSQEVAAFHQNDFSNQPSGSNVVSKHVENSMANLNMVASWFKQFGTLRNGQIPPLYQGKLAGSGGAQFSILKPSQNVDIHSSVEQLDVADASQSGGVLPSTAPAVVASEPLPASYVLSSDVIGQSVATVRPKKRKAMTSERLSWNKEVTEGFKKFQDISIAEQDWAQASNRLIEKVEDVEMIQDGSSLLRTKRKLILTTQLMQQLLCPAPAPLFRANAASHYDSVVCYVARLSLGDACSLTYGKINDMCKPISGNVISEELKVSKSTDAKNFSKAVEHFISRSKKLENELLRLDKAVSVLDIRLECEELEKASVINRFAKFHIRSADVSGTASSSGTAAPRMPPQRYVTALPMPSNVPEGEQCLSL